MMATRKIEWVALGALTFCASLEIACRRHGQVARESAASVPLTDNTPLPVATAPPAPPAEDGIVVRSVEGKVEARGVDGQVRQLTVGAALAIDDLVRTGHGASATIAMGSASVEIHPDSRLAVTEVAHDVSRLLLSAGRLSAEIEKSGGQRLRVELPSSDAVAMSAGGRFSVITDGAGALAVENEEGAVSLSAHGHSEEIKPGEQSVALAGQRPTPSRKIPPTLFLKVGHPPQRVQRETTLVLAGETQPGALLSISGKRAMADDRGRFTIVVALREGKNALVVEANDARGRHSRRSLHGVTVRTSAPAVKSRVRW